MGWSPGRCCFLCTAAVAVVAGTLELGVLDPTTQRRDGIVVGDTVTLGAWLEKEAGYDELCLTVDDDEERCVANVRDDGEIDLVSLAGFRAGTHLIRARLGSRRASTLVDTIPISTAAFTEEQEEVFESKAMRRRKVCVLTNSLESHSQNAVFVAASALLPRDKWLVEWFTPENCAASANVLAALSDVMVPIRPVSLAGGLDFRDLRSSRLANSSSLKLDQWVLANPRAARAMRSCDLALYANTFDVPDAAVLAELATALGERGSKRVMDLPNVPPPTEAAVDAFIAPSRYVAGALERGEVPCAVIYPAFLEPTLLVAPERAVTSLTVAQIGRLSPERSPGLFVRAVAEMRRRRPDLDFRAIHVGDGPLRPHLEALSSRLGAGVEYFGAVPRARVLEILRDTVDLLIQPRVGETFGVANAEAAALGLTVVGYAASGARESGGPAAVLVDSLEPAVIAEASLGALLAGNALARQLAPEHARKFSQEVAQRAYDAYFSALVEEHEEAGELVDDGGWLGGAPVLRIGFSDASLYAAPLLLKAFAELWPHATVEASRIDEESCEAPLDITVASCLDGGCGSSWEPRCAAAALAYRDRGAARGARGHLLICGEPWDLTDAACSFDLLLLTTTTPGLSSCAPVVYLPVVATAFGELRDWQPASLLEPRGGTFEARSGVAYLYHRCRPVREAFVDVLKSEGLRVDAMGACAGTDTPRQPSQGAGRFGERWHDAAVEAYSSSRFVVAFENTEAPGYVTEKLALAFLSGAVPLFWGDASAAAIFNRDAYVDCTGSLAACAARVREIDANETEWTRMASQPSLLPDGLARLTSTDLHRDLQPLATRLARLALRSL